jgi:hypothetical protein
VEGWGGEKINDANEKLETKQINKWIEEYQANLDSMMCTIFLFFDDDPSAAAHLFLCKNKKGRLKWARRNPV